MASGYVEIDGTLVHVHQPEGRIERYAVRRRRFWCFKCRKRHLHALMIWRPSEPSYYDPEVWWACERCGEDNRAFPFG